MRMLVRACLAASLFLAAACSMRATLDRFVSAEDKAFAFAFVESVRSGDTGKLEAEFDPELWEKSRDKLDQGRALFPVGKGETRIIGYNSSTSFTPGLRETKKDIVLVTTDGKHWTRTSLSTYARNGPARITAWNVEGLSEPPPELAVMDAWDSAVPWIRAGIALFVVGMIALIWWLVRRSRRRAARTI